MFSVESLESCYGGGADRAAAYRTSQSCDLAEPASDDVAELEHLRQNSASVLGGAASPRALSRPPSFGTGSGGSGAWRRSVSDPALQRAGASRLARSSSQESLAALSAAAGGSPGAAAGQQLAAGALRSITSRARAVYYLAPERIMGQRCTDKVRARCRLQRCIAVPTDQCIYLWQAVR